MRDNCCIIYIQAPWKVCTVKTVSVRIDEGQAKKLHEVASQIEGYSISTMVKRGVELFLEQEAPVYLAAFKEIKAKIPHTKRQAVVTDQ